MLAAALLIPAFFAGVLMFLAPCTLPLVPGYLAFISGIPEEEASASRRRVLKNAAAFALGFSIVFILFGLFAGAFGVFLGTWRLVLSRAAGAVLVLFGLTMLGLFRLPILSGEYRARMPSILTVGKPQSSFLMGALFALGWSPCIGPVLGTILLMASASATALQGAYLLAVFSLGFSLPFLAAAFFIERAAFYISRLGSLAQGLSVFGGLLLILLGALMLSGNIGLITTWGLNIPLYGNLLNYL